jgi:hypothetical protein
MDKFEFGLRKDNDRKDTQRSYRLYVKKASPICPITLFRTFLTQTYGNAPHE